MESTEFAGIFTIMVVISLAVSFSAVYCFSLGFFSGLVIFYIAFIIVLAFIHLFYTPLPETMEN